MEYKSEFMGFLTVESVKSGDKLKLIEPAYSTFSEAKQKTYWNVKVELPDGSHKLAGINEISGDSMVKKWGKNTDEWVGHMVSVDIKVSKGGVNYIVLVPTDDVKTDVPKQENSKPEPIEYPQEEVNVNDIPF